MVMPPGLRKTALTLHVCMSVGWLGAVVTFLALTVIGMTSRNEATVRGAYLVMEPAARYVLIPLALASLLTGIIQSLGTPWGLLRHYWVIFKLVINLVATAVLLIYMQTFKALAAVAADPGADIATVRNVSPGLHAILAIVVLIAAMILAIFKPRALTPYGLRRQQQDAANRRPVPAR